MRLLSSLFALSLFAASSSAQLQFDLIYLQDVSLPTFGGSAGGGLLVNTGSEPLYQSAWNEALHSTLSAEAFASFKIEPLSFNWAVLQPGEAVGELNPEFQSLLAPTETVIGPFDVLQYQTILLDGTAPASTQVDARIEMGGQRIELAHTWTHPGGWSSSNAVRVSSSAAPVLGETTNAGCAHPSFGALPIEFGLHGKAVEPSVFGFQSNLPLLGNPFFGYRVETGGMQEFTGSPWIFSIMPDTGSLPLFGCDLANFVGPGLVQQFGAIEGVVGPFGGAPEMVSIEIPLPLPAQPNLAGVALQAQWALVTPTAANGLFSVSPALRSVLAASDG